ncbi:MAG: hypothetical protein ACRD0K_15005, partial [Egibacteraceae bacterium]
MGSGHWRAGARRVPGHHRPQIRQHRDQPKRVVSVASVESRIDRTCPDLQGHTYSLSFCYEPNCIAVVADTARIARRHSSGPLGLE